MYNFYQTAIAVRNQLSKEDRYYKLKKELLKQIVASVFDNEEAELTKLEIQYELIKFSSLPESIVVDITKKLLDAFSITMKLQEVKDNFAYRKVLIFKKI